MLSKLLVFFTLLYLGVAQPGTTTDMPSTAMPSTAMPSTAMPSTAMPSTAMPSTDMTSTDMTSTDMTSTDMTSTDMTSTNPSTTEVPTMDPNSLYARYNMQQARDLRQRNFYCLDFTDTSFPPETTNSDGTVNRIYWSVLFQYPVISFLDIRRKENLLALIAGVVQQGAEATSSASTLNETDLCVGPVDHYRVSYYDESVLLRLYFRNTTTPPMTIMELDNYFRIGFRRITGSSTDDRVQTFLERDALAIDSIMPAGGFINENSHPGAQGLTSENDPTLRAVFISSFVGSVTLETATTSRTGRMQEFANNPRPINYGLEAGDIVFAVFGSIFLGIVGFLAILGFCIHPFFLA